MIRILPDTPTETGATCADPATSIACGRDGDHDERWQAGVCAYIAEGSDDGRTCAAPPEPTADLPEDEDPPALEPDLRTAGGVAQFVRHVARKAVAHEVTHARVLEQFERTQAAAAQVRRAGRPSEPGRLLAPLAAALQDIGETATSALPVEALVKAAARAIRDGHAGTRNWREQVERVAGLLGCHPAALDTVAPALKAELASLREVRAERDDLRRRHDLLRTDLAAVLHELGLPDALEQVGTPAFEAAVMRARAAKRALDAQAAPAAYPSTTLRDSTDGSRRAYVDAFADLEAALQATPGGAEAVATAKGRVGLLRLAAGRLRSLVGQAERTGAEQVRAVLAAVRDHEPYSGPLADEVETLANERAETAEQVREICAELQAARAGAFVPPEVKADEVSSGSVVLRHMSDIDLAVTVRRLDGRGWNCCGQPVEEDGGAPSWAWSRRVRGRVWVLATGLTADEAAEVAGLDSEAAIAWCRARALRQPPTPPEGGLPAPGHTDLMVAPKAAGDLPDTTPQAPACDDLTKRQLREAAGRAARLVKLVREMRDAWANSLGPDLDEWETAYPRTAAKVREALGEGKAPADDDDRGDEIRAAVHAAKALASEEIDARDVRPGSVVLHEPTNPYGWTVTVRHTSGNGWHCDAEGGPVFDGHWWAWTPSGREFDRCRELATALTREECEEVAALDADDAVAWCERRARRLAAEQPAPDQDPDDWEADYRAWKADQGALPRVVEWADLRPGDLALDAGVLAVDPSGRALWRHESVRGTWRWVSTGQRACSEPAGPSTTTSRAILLARDVPKRASAIRAAYEAVKGEAEWLAKQVRRGT